MSDLKQYLIDEFVEDYQDGRMTRREALKRLIGLTGSAILANAVLAACTPAAQQAPTSAPPTSVPPTAALATATAAQTPTEIAATATAEATASATASPDAADIQASMVEFPGQDATLMGYQARPGGDEPVPIVLVCHENRGLTAHIQDVTRRLAQAGYAALAVDLLSRQGGSAAVDASQVPGVLGNTPPEQFVEDFRSGLAYLQGQPNVRADRAGMTGFCFGGGMTWRCTTKIAELRAAVPFYGPNPPLEDVPGIRAAVLAIYGELDQRINQGIPAIEHAMQQNGKTFEKIIYPNANHAFHNDIGGNYNPDAARDAWARTLAWFDRYLRT
jgi:carboxymethylenebutenolidase